MEAEIISLGGRSGGRRGRCASDSEMRIAALITALLVGVVLGNTESIRISGESNWSEERDVDGYLLDSENWSRRVDTLPEGGQKWYKVQGVQGRQYEVRVCWPASSPGDFSLDYKDGYVRLRHVRNYHSHLDWIELQTGQVPFEIILDPLVLGLLPNDIVTTIGLVSVTCLAGLWVSSFPFKLGLL
ncbi:hypothetical protein TRICI_004793 [Trichomonascus ciferrii]|uniref:Uncharacterized protein n=1 Tax=Trichomonascus ciferrii TaxID=44093 RepID=A0A642V5L6_9ASCO|nr:hypothetical protein TRICI_004793 [Trichomonascus ciferrii]